MKKKEKQKKAKEISTKQVMKNVIYSFGEVFKFNKPYFFSCIIIQMFAMIFYAFSGTYYIKWVVEAIENHVEFAKIAALVISFVAIMIAEGILEWLFYNYINDIVHHRFLQNYNKRIFKKAGNVELACYENPEFYNKYTRALDRTPERIMNVFYNSVGTIGKIVQIIFMLSVMISMDKWIALFIIFPIIGNFVFGKIYNYYEQKIYKENTKSNRIIYYVKRVLHLNQYAKEMRITDIYPLIQQKHKQAVDDVCGVYDKYSGRRFVFAWIKSKFTYTLLFEGMVLYCAYKALVNGTMSLAEITVMTSIMGSTAWTVIGIFESIMDIHKDSIYVQNAREFLSYDEKIPEDSDGIDMPDSIESVEFRNVCFSYDKKTDNIHNLSMKINAGESVAIAGINGARYILKTISTTSAPTSTGIRA